MIHEKQQNGLAGRIRTLFTGRSSFSSQNFHPSVGSPKSPGPRLGISILSSPTIDIPGLHAQTSPSSRLSASPHLIEGTNSPTSFSIAVLPPARSRQSAFSVHPSSPPPPRSGQSSPHTNGQWESVRDRSGNTRRRRRRSEHARSRRGVKNMFREQAGRMKLIRCVGLGSILAIGLTVYLALALSNVINGLNVHIFIIVIGLLLVMAFAHALVRLCMYILRPPQYPISRATSNATVAPAEPIPVILRRDEEEVSDDEADGVPKDAVLPAPPPVYGLWRGSTRMDPNLIHWQKVEHLQREAATLGTNTFHSGQPSSPYRPPSYATEDGVRYVLDAQPRSIAPEALPLHPSERGRIASGMF